MVWSLDLQIGTLKKNLWGEWLALVESGGWCLLNSGAYRIKHTKLVKDECI